MAKRDNPDYLKKLAARFDNSEAQVGFFDSARYEDGTPVATAAAASEYGVPSKNIPPRSFMRSTMHEKARTWSKVIANVTKVFISGTQELDDVMETIGLIAAGDMRKKITQISNPPLKESTIKARKSRGNSSTKPLVDTRTMLPALTHTVVKK